MPDQGKCRSCGAEIVWIKTRNGKAMPCDPKRLSVVTVDGDTITGYEPHWGSCPSRAQHKKPPAPAIAKVPPPPQPIEKMSKKQEKDARARIGDLWDAIGGRDDQSGE